ncbi:DUF58 domain-containing protein [Humisphaera borealis]|uniref:DUF58 domain-containing protein n=1 Tax=Humisphaera borealis TaxID=2807512 RepID=A0A7M2WWQ8_9BACT|nr:DUF58 domain-containing protein [Humisphaera borealis]QOV89829.1 DUF58 domain-containing protein [Humisphaera borealis]
MPIPKYQYFAPADAARMSGLELSARQVVEGLFIGQHKSPHKGFSVEFSEHREYVAGDDVRHMDWRAYGRADRYYIKLFEQETNLRATIVIDTSASMTFGTPTKIDYARHLAACLAYLLSKQQDLAGLVAVDESVTAELPPGSSAAHLDRLFKALEAIKPGVGTELSKQLHALSERLPRRTLVILISDLWTEPDEFIKALQHLRHRKHQAMVIHLLDRAELDLPYDRMVTLEDLETKERLQINPADVRENYKQQIGEYLTKIRRVCADTDVEYHDLFVEEAYDKALVKLLARRT